MGKSKDWIDNIEDNELEKLPREDIVVYKTPQRIDDKIYGIIKNTGAKDGKKKNVSRFFHSRITRVVFAAAGFMLVVLGGYFMIKRTGLLPSPEQNSIITKIFFTQGSVVVHKDSRSRELHPGDSIDVNSSVTTGETSVCALALEDRANVLLRGNSGLRFIQLAKDPDINVALSLEYGTGFFDVGALSAQSTFLVGAEGIRIHVIGTQFLVQAEPGGPVIIALRRGKLGIDSGEGTARTVVTENRMVEID